MSKVSIIVPFLEGKGYLEECIQSIEMQRCIEYEIILVHDKNGQDVPEGVLKKEGIVYVNLLDEIKEWRIKEDSSPEKEELWKSRPYGVAVARNVGIQKAIGRYIYFWDADDFLLEGTLEKLVRLAEEKNALFVTSNKASTWFRPASFDWEKTKRETQVEGVQPLEGEALGNRFRTSFSAQGILLNREFVLQNGFQFDRDNKFYSDYPFIVGALAKSKGRAWIDGDSHYIWRHHNDSLHYPALRQKKAKRRAVDFIKSYKSAVAYIPEEENTLRRLLGRHLCAFTIKKFPKRLKGKLAVSYTDQLSQLTDKSIIKDFAFMNRRILSLLMRRKYRMAKITVGVRNARKKKFGLFWKKLQYFLLLEKKIFRKMSLKENWVLIESFYGKGYSDSPKYLYEYLLNTEGKKYRYIWCLNSKSPNIKGKPTIVKRFSLRYIYYTSRCKYQIYNTRQPYWMKKRDGMVLLETWHGTPLKKLVFDLDDIHAASQDHKIKFYKQSRDWDYLISANPFSTDVFERAFHFPRERIIEYGYPRNDILYTQNRDEIVKEVRSELSIPEGKKVMLYAPTWRDNQFYGKGRYKFSLAMDLGRMKEEFGGEYILLLRTHYYIADQIDLTGLEDFAINASRYEDISRLYLVSDLCITDYSSVFFDYANLRRPILFFAYDYEDYKDEIRGLYIDMEKDLPGPIVQTNEDLIQILKNLDEVVDRYEERYEKFYNRFCCVDDGKACERTIEKVFG